MRRKFIWGVILVIFVAGVTYLAVSGSKTLATTDNGKITQADYYDEVKQSSAGRQVFAQMVINKVLDKKYGKEVTTADVDKQYATLRAQYGDSKFKQYLSQAGMTEKQYKESLREKQVMQAAVKANYKISADKLKEAYDNYVPDTTISLITAKDEDSAQAAIDALDSGESWDDVYKQYSQANSAVSGTGQMAAFDSTNTNVDSEIRKAAFNQDAGVYSASPVKGTNGTFYVVRTDAMAEKPAQSKIESKLKDKITNDFINDTNNQDEMKKIIGKLLNKANVNIKDSDLKSALTGYLTAN
ncbi:Peptidyl-prolyl isomerase [Fructobacillus fructosus]|uniref:Foldase protein PrsA n=1 Tax=Fructobacillus fructosus TaxID=1631 RepID=A0ABN9YPT4_9LACO|nr:peptidylprolyl isomerase [Fructobacillus fructosus]KRN53169.1 parvulin-like peptidyl-prolyl isomerase [Fructobacillus fructosus KCTC 3544]MCK8638284.1 peptidylprolyl isomerase [Fructobacillus fructosus]CAK1234116.1 Peptidyl-prolyl isomerase [Fructobacillus fructosus]CAK1237017.1 Peptidyl-prolyl isomerase [Fructobacillus fructosus]GAP00945.1 foldase protein PrsA [Fructobacillus fructosus]